MSKIRKPIIDVRLMCSSAISHEVVDKLEEQFEKGGFELVEENGPFGCRPPDEEKVRVYFKLRQAED